MTRARSQTQQVWLQGLSSSMCQFSKLQTETQAELEDGYIFFDSHFHSFRRGKGREEKVTGRTGVAERSGDRTLSGPEAGVWAHIQTHRDPTTPSPAGLGRPSQETSWKMASYQATWVPG